MTKDLTTGSPMRLILGFALPTLLGMLFQQLYNMMDTMIVGKLLGATALAAVGSTGSINFFVIGFCMGVCNGFAIPVAQRMGAGDYSQMRRYVANAAWLAVAFAVVLTVATGLLCGTILTTMNTPADIYHGAYWYIFIIFMGIPATFLYNLLAAIIRSLGDSKTPVYFLAMSSVLNIGLDLLFINAVGFALMGVDKRRAKRDQWRISEKSLFLPPLLGGTVGAILGMRVFHHKTKHWYFRYGLPALLVLQLALAGWLSWKLK